MSLINGFEHLRIPLEAIKLATNNFDDGNVIGRGGFGKVYRGELPYAQGQIITAVMKRLDRSLGQGTTEFWKEVMLLSRYEHKNIVSLVGFCDEIGEKILVNNYESRGSLDRYLGSTDLTWIMRLQICLGAARGLSYLHDPSGTQQRLLHRDIKSSNILLDENWEAKISDFGLSKIGPANQQFTFLVSNAVGTVGYCDPLYIETGVLTKESDTYSFGVVLFEVLCGRLAIDNYDDERRFLPRWATRCYEEKKLDEIIDPTLRKQMHQHSLSIFSAIAYMCLKKDREERPTMDEVVRKLEGVLHIQQEFQNPSALQQVGGSQTEEPTVQDAEFEAMLQTKKLEHFKIPFEDIRNATHNFHPECRIGGGAFGGVYKAELFHIVVRKDTRENDIEAVTKGETFQYLRIRSKVAVKRLDPRYGQGKTQFLQEIEILSCFTHKNLIPLLGFCYEEPEMILVYELAANRSLDCCYQKAGRIFSHNWGQRLQICLDVAQGLNYLHNGVAQKYSIHRDIKSPNILLGGNWEGIIGDFGFSVICDGANREQPISLTDYSGTPGYIDPEYRKTHSVSTKSDVYSFGVLLFEILCGKLAELPQAGDDPQYLLHIVEQHFRQNTVNDVIDKNLKKDFVRSSSIPDSINIFAQIAHQCVQNNRADRPTMEEVVKGLKKALKSHITGVEVLSLATINSVTNYFGEKNIIGKGASSKVYKGKLLLSNRRREVAIKRLNPNVGSYDEDEFLKRISLLFSYSHKNVIPLLGFCEEDNEKIIVFARAMKGSLDEHIGKSILSWKQWLQICINAAHGLNHIHVGVANQHTVHGDIKSSNILLHSDWKATICDFVISKADGTLGYQDPLHIRSKKSDVYSFGVVLFEILCGRLAVVKEFEDERRFLSSWAPHCLKNNKLKEIIPHDIKKIDKDSLDTLSNIANDCLSKDREQRPTMSEVIQELEKAFEFQDEWEWEQILPKDYEKIIQMSKSPEICSMKKREIYTRLSLGILLHNEKVFFSITTDGCKNEMISATKFSYKNLRSLKWKHTKQSRFRKIAKMSDISNLNIHVNIRTQFLSPGIIYGAFLVFKFGNRGKISSEPTYVKLKYKTSGGTLNAYVAEWRDEEWMMIELCRFVSHNQATDFEVVLKSFSDYSCGTGAIFVDGIEFRPVDKVDPENRVQQSLSIDSNIDWWHKLPSDYQEIFKRSQEEVAHLTKKEVFLLLSKGILIDKGEKLFSLSQVDGKKCHLLRAKAVIHSSSNVCLHGEAPAQSRFAEVVQILCQQVFHIKCNIETKILSADTNYACYLVFKLPENCSGLKSPLKIQNLLPKNDQQTKIIYLRSPSPVNLHKNKTVAKQREDGWMEVIVWDFSSNNEHSDDYCPMDLKLICFEATLFGLVINGIEFRPI